MSQNHMTKKELNEDPFFEEVAHIVDFFKKHQTLLIAIVSVLIVALIVVFGGSAIMRNQNEKAAGQYGIAMDYYNKAQYVEAEDNFMILAEQYKRNDWGKRAYYYLALVSKNLGNDAIETLEYLEKFVSTDLDDTAMKAAAFKLIAAHYYGEGDLIMAADNYLKASKKALSLKEKLDLGIKAGNLYIESDNASKKDAVVNYLLGLDLSKSDEVRVKALTFR